MVAAAVVVTTLHPATRQLPATTATAAMVAATPRPTQVGAGIGVVVDTTMGLTGGVEGSKPGECQEACVLWSHVLNSTQRAAASPYFSHLSHFPTPFSWVQQRVRRVWRRLRLPRVIRCLRELSIVGLSGIRWLTAVAVSG